MLRGRLCGSSSSLTKFSRRLRFEQHRQVPAAFRVISPLEHGPTSLLSRDSRPLHLYSQFYSTSSVLAKPPSAVVRDEDFDEPDAAHQPASLERSVEEQYSRKTPLEHVLLRPGMYVGPNERLPPNTCWVLDPLPSPDNTTEPPVPFRMVRKEYGLVPALIKIFDEILVNASDNRLRHPKSCTRIDVVIDPGNEQEGRAADGLLPSSTPPSSRPPSGVDGTQNGAPFISAMAFIE